MDILTTLLYPLIFIFKVFLELFKSLTGGYGIAIILLSVFVSALSYPLSRYGQKVESGIKRLHDEMDPRVNQVKQKYKGEKQFLEIEKIYKEYNYHPIYAVKSVAGFAMQLPFLISCLLLLIDYPPLAGESFLFLDDLGKPDELITVGGFSINILPVFMALITVYETTIKPEMTSSSRFKFYFITLVIFLLIYALPSAVVLYWTTSTLISLLFTIRRATRMENVTHEV